MNKQPIGDDPDLSSVELLIRAAGDYVVPSDSLRPRTLETARAANDDRVGVFNLAKILMVLLFCSACSVPALHRLSAWHEKSVSPSASEIQHQAVRIAAEKRISLDWGLLEAFNELRSHRATNLGNVSR